MLRDAPVGERHVELFGRPAAGTHSANSACRAWFLVASASTSSAFHQLAALIAAHGGRLVPDVGRTTRVGVELDSARPA
jgi:hypothetical protein